MGRTSHTPERQAAPSTLQGMEESDSEHKSSIKRLRELAHGIRTPWRLSDALSCFQLPQTALEGLPASFLQHVGTHHLSSSEFQTRKGAEGRNDWVKRILCCLPTRQTGWEHHPSYSQYEKHSRVRLIQVESSDWRSIVNNPHPALQQLCPVRCSCHWRVTLVQPSSCWESTCLKAMAQIKPLKTQGQEERG